jgi:peptide/nickel transport system substrate-binding protein
MQFRLFKLRFRRRLRASQKQVEGLGLQAEQGLERNFFRRLSNLGRVWRFIAAWAGLLVIILVYQAAQLEGLSTHYQSLRPVAGGSYSEGILGRFTNADPLFATGEVDSSVSKLIFASLFTYDTHNRLVGDLAERYDVDPNGTVYTVHLRPNLTWQDGQRLTADDVVFTYRTIQNPDVQSPLAGGWQNIKVAKKDAYTVVFTLPTPLTSFPSNLTNGIVPQHLLASYPPGDLRSVDFNTVHPVGAGPFAWSALQVKNPGHTGSEVLIALKAFQGYHAGPPKLNNFVVDVFGDQQSMIGAFRKQQLNGMVGLNSVPSGLNNDETQRYSLILTAANMAFFNTASPVLSDAQVRRALVMGTDVPGIIKGLGYNTRAVNEPFLNGQLGYDKMLAQAHYQVNAAISTLNQAGWVPGNDGIRTKGGKPLKFTLYALDTPENKQVTNKLRQNWRALGADVQTHLEADDELRGTLSAHSYDSVLYGISIGVDPDVYVYWHSSQTDPRSTRLNFSQYKSTGADAALEAGRTRLDPTLRTIKYHPFLQAWQQDAPAVGLYQPRFLYLTNEKVYGLEDQQVINTGTDRLNNVQDWMVRTAHVTNN